MAIYKSVKGTGKHPSRLKALLDYVTQEEKEGERVYKTTGINVSDNQDTAFKQMMMTKRLHDNTQGRQYRHHVIAFKEGEIDGEKAHELGLEFAQKHFKGFDVFIATHVDKKHIHCHLIINNVERETGAKFNELNKREFCEVKEGKRKRRTSDFVLEELKESMNELCRENNLSVIERGDRASSLNIYDMKHYKALTKNKGKDSYKTQLAFTVKRALKKARSKEEFISFMEKEEIKVDWKDTKKNVTFKFADEKKKSIRLSNLKKTYKDEEFDKERMLEIFKTNSQKQEVEKEENEEEVRARILAEVKEEQAREEQKKRAESVTTNEEKRRRKVVAGNKKKRENEKGERDD